MSAYAIFFPQGLGSNECAVLITHWCEGTNNVNLVFFVLVTVLQLEDSVAWCDRRLKADDLVVEVNGQDLRQATPDRAAQAINDAGDRIKLVILRQAGPPEDPQDSEAMQALLNEFPSEAISRESSALRTRQEKLINIKKGSKESLGISVSGGRGGPRGDVPVFVTNVQADGCVGRQGQLKVTFVCFLVKS